MTPQTPPKIRSYAFPLSGDFSAKLDLFGEAQSAEDLDALSDFVTITVKALKRSLRPDAAMASEAEEEGE